MNRTLLMFRKLSRFSAIPARTLKTTDKHPSQQFPEDSKIISRFRVNWSLMKFTPEFLEQAKFNESIKSQPFEIVAGRIKTKWWIRFCPNGDYTEKMFSIYLMKQEESSQNYDINCRFSLMNGDQELHFYEMRTLRAAEIEVNSGRGVGEFMTHDDFFLRLDEFVKGSELRIRTDVKITAPITEGEVFLTSGCRSKIVYKDEWRE